MEACVEVLRRCRTLSRYELTLEAPGSAALHGKEKLGGPAEETMGLRGACLSETFFANAATSPTADLACVALTLIVRPGPRARPCS